MRLNDRIVSHNVPAYSSHYPRHPRRVITTKDGVMIIPSALDPFTSMNADVMKLQRARHPFATRAKIEEHWRATFDRLLLGTSPSSAQIVRSAPEL